MHRVKEIENVEVFDYMSQEVLDNLSEAQDKLRAEVDEMLSATTTKYMPLDKAIVRNHTEEQMQKKSKERGWFFIDGKWCRSYEVKVYDDYYETDHMKQKKVITYISTGSNPAANEKILQIQELGRRKGVEARKPNIHKLGEDASIEMFRSMQAAKSRSWEIVASNLNNSTSVYRTNLSKLHQAINSTVKVRVAREFNRINSYSEFFSLNPDMTVRWAPDRQTADMVVVARQIPYNYTRIIQNIINISLVQTPLVISEFEGRARLMEMLVPSSRRIQSKQRAVAVDACIMQQLSIKKRRKSLDANWPALISSIISKGYCPKSVCGMPKSCRKAVTRVLFNNMIWQK